MALIATRGERLFHVPEQLTFGNFLFSEHAEIHSKTPINITVENDRSSANDNVQGIGRGRSYTSRIKGTLEYEEPLSVVGLVRSLPGEMTETQVARSTATSELKLPVSGNNLLPNSAMFNVYEYDRNPTTALTPTSTDPASYGYTNAEHSITLTDVKQNVKVMVEPGGTGSLAKLSVSAMGNLARDPYVAPVTSVLDSVGERQVQYIPTSGAQLYFWRSGSTTPTELTRLMSVTVDFGIEITHPTTLDGTGYAEPTITKVAPMIEVTRLYTNDRVLNDLINNNSKLNLQDTSLRAMLRLESGTGDEVIFITIPRVNFTEPTYSDDGEVKTQTFTIEQQAGHLEVESGEPIVVAITEPEVATAGPSGQSDDGASGGASGEDDE